MAQASFGLRSKYSRGFANLYEEPFVVVGHVVNSGCERRKLGFGSDGVDREVLHQQLV